MQPVGEDRQRDSGQAVAEALARRGVPAVEQARFVAAMPSRYFLTESPARAHGHLRLLRLGRHLRTRGRQNEGTKYWQAGLTVANALFDDPYLSRDAKHQGLILHSVYHRPNGWDHVPPGAKTPRGESSMWGDYHAREAALYVDRVRLRGPYLKFYLGSDQEVGS